MTITHTLRTQLRAARRPGAEAAVALDRRRVWYDDTGEEGQAQDSPGEGQSDSGEQGGEQPLPPDLQALIDEVRRDPAGIARHVKDLRAESAQQRVKAREAEAQRQAAEEKRLADEKKFEELAAQRKQQLDEVQPKLDRLEALEAHLQSSVEARVKALPAQYRGLVPKDYDPLKTLEWLDANAGILMQQRAPDLDSGAGNRGNGSGAAKLTAEEEAMARRMGLDPAKVAAQKTIHQG